MAKPKPISEVEKDHNPNGVKTVYNPLTYDFVHKFDGEPQELPSGEHTQFPEHVAVHLAKHLAKVIVTKVATDEREAILNGLDKNEAVKVKMKPFPRFNYRVGDVAKMLVMGSRDEKIVKTADVLNAAAEVKKGDKVVKTTDEITFVDDKKVGEDVKTGDTQGTQVEENKSDESTPAEDVQNPVSDPKGDISVKDDETPVEDTKPTEEVEEMSSEEARAKLTKKTNAELKEIIETNKLAEDLDLSEAIKKELVGIIMGDEQ